MFDKLRAWFKALRDLPTVQQDAAENKVALKAMRETMSAVKLASGRNHLNENWAVLVTGQGRETRVRFFHLGRMNPVAMMEMLERFDRAGTHVSRYEEKARRR